MYVMSDQAVNVKFVREVEKHPVLYDYTIPGYSRREETEKAWNEIGSKMNMTANECKDKWRNLRTVFSRRLKPPPSGSGVRRKAYYLADVMSFALPFIRTAPQFSSGQPAEGPEKDSSQAVSQDASEVSAGDDDGCDDDGRCSSPDIKPLLTQLLPSLLTPIPTIVKAVPSTSTSTTVQVLRQETEKNSSSSKKNRKRKTTERENSDAEVDKALAAYLKAKRARLGAAQCQGSSDDERKEAVKMFLLSLMPELVRFNDAQLKLFKRRVLSLIDDIELMETSHTASAPVTTSFSQPLHSSMSSPSASPSPSPALTDTSQLFD